jgi:predicted O-linked N-acetylglucosamine transferase (SPINDLY family)
MSSELFAEAVRRSASRDYGVADLLVAIDSLSRQGEKALMLELYRIWLRYNPEDPLACAVWFNFGTALSEQRDFVGAKAALQEAIKANPTFVPPYVNLGNVCEKLGSLDEAVIQWTNAANLVSAVTTENLTYKLTALKQIGRVLEQGRIDARAEDTMRMSIELDPHQHDIVQHWVALRQIQCKWPVVKPWGSVSYRALVRNLSPLSAAALVDDPIFQLANAFNYSKVDVLASRPQPVDRPATVDRRPDRRLRIGYVSSDLREHAVGYLTSEIFELHDRAAVEVFAYYCGMPGEDRTKIRVRSAVDHWIDITQMSDEDAARRIVADGIDILVDLNAYTKDGRLKLFAMQPAPIIVNWLGYPGTTGSRFHNYIVADERIIPPELEKFYSEKVLRLPCYQPTDRKRIVSDRRPTRAEAGLPDDAIVYCCFNGTQKITPAMFAAWMTILRSVPRSLLWLLGGSKETNARLLDMALGQGIAADRIVIADRMPNAEHLARYPLADVFLDTWPYGAHTTASDALWMGVPVVTLMGRGFASRVCGSLVSAAGCPELVTHTIDDYVSLAVALGHDASRVAELKRRLAANRDTCVLFDTPLLVTRLEALYREMWLDYLGGRLPLPDLTNLETIHEIGCEPGVLDFESIDAGRAYEDVYRAKLIERRALIAALHDRRVAGGPAPVAVESETIRRVA